MRQRIVVGGMIGALAVAAAGMRPEAARKPEKPGWTNLFDGASLAGWKASEHPDAWTVADGMLSCNGDRSHLFYAGDVQGARFENFEAEVEVKTNTGANSGVFILTAWQDAGWPIQGFEIQVNNTQPVFPGDSGAAYRENKKTGSLYGIRNTYKALARDNEWFTLKIRVQAPRIVVHVNDALVVDYVEPEGEVAGLAAPLQKIGAGTFALQCHDTKSQVQYRRIAVHPLPPAPAPRAPNPDPAFAKRYRLARDNFPLVDLRAVDAAATSRLEPALAAARAGGLFVGVTAAAGKGRPVKTDADVAALVKRYGGKPLFLGLRVETPDWAAHLSPKVLGSVDYVLFDSNTALPLIPPSRLPEPCKDECIASAIVDLAVRALDAEPIDVFAWMRAGPPLSDALRQRLIDAAVRNKVAFEINGSRKEPDEAFVRKAKAAGAKFTLGECAVDTPAGAYCFDIVEKAGLGWRDMYDPAHGPMREGR